jgi:diaminohydroxyphosphoribosylaminopyrimidine deaminase/5-amino-6-(5-phosphoribosylamino)uracil reductase
LGQTVATERDERHLARAIELASEARGQTSPNPLVGAVIVKNGRTIGEGFHTAAGAPHAEREALAACSEDPAGGTMYVSLEPCAHHGRTPPCTDAILAAAIERVVVASDDPTPKASGRGIGVLRVEGVEVDLAGDEIARQARLLNQPFRKHALTGCPLVVLKSAVTLDGRTATRTGDSRWISGEASRARVHAWRAEVDAVAVGIGTALADDPLLTARLAGVGRQPRRVVFDAHARLSRESRLVQTVDEAPVTVVCSPSAPSDRRAALADAGVETLVAEGADEAARVRSALDMLGELDVQSVLLEGGAYLAGAFLDAGEVDEVRAFVAPVLAGGREARPVAEGEGVGEIAGARRALEVEVERLGDDTLIAARFGEW